MHVDASSARPAEEHAYFILNNTGLSLVHTPVHILNTWITGGVQMRQRHV
jgi:hypothetical protein